MKIIGLDLGITSVGSAVVQIHENSKSGHILFAGARVFPAAEDAKTGDSLALPRRLARSARRRIDRRRSRLDALRALLASTGIPEAQLSPDQFQQLLREKKESAQSNGAEADHLIDPYRLRVKALDYLLQPWEWTRALMHIAARRGFRSNSKAQERDEKSDTGKMTTSVKETEALLDNANVRTIGEFVLTSEKFKQHRRNKGGSYAMTLKRDWLRDELKTLFAQQRGLGNDFASEALERDFISLFYEQRHYDQGNINEMIGSCEREPGEQRGARATWTFQRAMALQKINHLRWSLPGEQLRTLDAVQRSAILELAFTKFKVSYSDVRKKCDLPSDARFSGLSYKPKVKKNGEVSEPDPVKASESAMLVELKMLAELRRLIVDDLGEDVWKKLNLETLQIDAIGEALSKFKADDERLKLLHAAGVPESIAQTVLKLSFSGFGFLSVAALRKLLPHLEDGKRYDEAMETVYGDHRRISIAEKQDLLPQIPSEDVRNPVVLRALSQARKVLNALIRAYGTPNRVHIEMARDLGKTRDERNKIKEGQDAFRDEKASALRAFAALFPDYGPPKGDDLLKFRLWRDQEQKCLYSGESIGAAQLLVSGVCEIDHILPLSRSQDDGQHNKALVKTKCNREKGNRTPFEWLGGDGDSEAWRTFESRVLSNPKLRTPKRNRLLRREFSTATADGFKERNLNDTRYITRYFKTFVETHLKIDVIEGDKQAVFTGTGNLTSFLRAQWGLLKVRGEGDRHHALDAIVIACATRSLEQRLTKYHHAMEIRASDPASAAEVLDLNTGEITASSYKDLRRHFPKPWASFRDDVIAAYDDVFVSRPPRRKWSGPLHKETVYAIGATTGTIQQRIRIENVKLATLDKAIEPARNAKLYAAIRERLERHADDPKKAWATELFLDSPTGGRIVRAITIVDKMSDGVRVRGGIAANGEIVRVDVYKDAKGKNYCVPIYVSDFGKQTPRRAVVAFAEYSAWKLMDESYSFCFSLYKDDLVFVSDAKLDEHLKRNGITPSERHHFVYFNGIDRATGSISYDTPNHRLLSEKVDKKTGEQKLADLRCGAQSLKQFEKYTVDVLGQISYVKKERHLALAKRAHQQADEAEPGQR